MPKVDVQNEKGTNQGGGDSGDHAAGGASAEAGQTAQANWYDTYPEDIRGDLKGYDKPETLAKEHIELKKKYAVPEDIKAYEFDVKDIDEQTQKSIDAFRSKAKEFGLTKDQFKNLIAFELASRNENEKQGRVKREEFRKQSEETLKKEFGNKYDEKIKGAIKTMSQIFPPQFGKFLEDTGLGNHPDMIRALVRLTESISEDVLVRNQKVPKPSNRDPQTGEPMLKFTSMK